jgi:hypothetical protein
MGVNGQGMKLITYVHPLLRLGMRGAIPLLPLYAFMVWTGHFLFLHDPIWLGKWLPTFQKNILPLPIGIACNLEMFFQNVVINVPDYMATHIWKTENLRSCICRLKAAQTKSNI